MKAYEEVVKSASFVRGDFNTGNARKLAKEIEKSKFFDVDHDLELYNVSTKSLEKVNNINDLKAKLATDVDIVLEKYPSLRNKFDKMISDLSTDTRSGLRKLLESHDTKDIIILMNNPNTYKRRLWWGYIKGVLAEFDEMQRIGGEIKDRLSKIIENAKNEATDWDAVVELFNNRFRNL